MIFRRVFCADRLKITQMQQHRPSNTQSEAYKQLQEKIAHQLETWKEKYMRAQRGIRNKELGMRNFID